MTASRETGHGAALGVPPVRTGAVLAAYRAAIALAGTVPPSAASPVLDRLADLVRLAAPGPRRAVERNLAQVLGGRGKRHAWAVRGVFRHVLRNYYDTFRLPAMSADEVRRSTVLQGREHLDAALAAGTGAILVTAHVSSVALATQALVLHTETPATVAVEPVEPPELLDLLLRVRGSHGVRYVPLGPALFGELTAALRRNELVCLVVDRDVGGGGIPVEFFGRPATLPTGPALLALRTGAPIIPAFASRRPDGRLDGHLASPLIVTRGGSRRETVAEISGLVTRRLEYHIGTFPEQWTVLQDVWERDYLAIHRPATTESA